MAGIINTFIASVMNYNIEKARALQSALHTAITNNRRDTIIFYGKGANGKSALSNAINNVIHDTGSLYIMYVEDNLLDVLENRDNIKSSVLIVTNEIPENSKAIQDCILFSFDRIFTYDTALIEKNPETYSLRDPEFVDSFTNSRVELLAWIKDGRGFYTG